MNKCSKMFCIGKVYDVLRMMLLSLFSFSIFHGYFKVCGIKFYTSQEIQKFGKIYSVEV